MPKEIKLTKGHVAIVDDEDYPVLARFPWYANVNGNTVYALCDVRAGKQRVTLRMHRMVVGLTSETHEVDHFNRNGLDNRKENLKVCTHKANIQSGSWTKKGRTSRFRGVSWHKAKKKWVACIKASGVSHRLGYFASEEDAAQAFVNAAEQLFEVGTRYVVQ